MSLPPLAVAVWEGISRTLIVSSFHPARGSADAFLAGRQCARHSLCRTSSLVHCAPETPATTGSFGPLHSVHIYGQGYVWALCSSRHRRAILQSGASGDGEYIVMGAREWAREGANQGMYGLDAAYAHACVWTRSDDSVHPTIDGGRAFVLDSEHSSR